jgi:hypothetical protein
MNDTHWRGKISAQKGNTMKDKPKQLNTEGLKDWDQFANEDLPKLGNFDWEIVAYYIWHDAAKKGDMLHAQKWVGMISARLLHSIAEDSKAVRKLTNVLVFLTLALVALTLVLAWDAFHH